MQMRAVTDGTSRPKGDKRVFDLPHRSVGEGLQLTIQRRFDIVIGVKTDRGVELLVD